MKSLADVLAKLWARDQLKDRAGEVTVKLLKVQQSLLHSRLPKKAPIFFGQNTTAKELGASLRRPLALGPT
jgi:hypothetical protein